ncbi:cytochrome c biogenesis protein CcsA [Geomonas paludis]|uniref:Cytochrome c biogenesis protein CcsA n=1 Tax=Geomonas paludis TaxID=2740185 RepID=A0ABY4LIX8_9BACT|nr:cytochrome c biogenesis protein CcsA [Geomonas paludis]UPU36733.1 cytochrome c biogenesis protein CcsA [Geomonas paludis]
MKPELVYLWIAVALYGVSSFSYIFGLISRSEKLYLLGLWTALAGFVPHVAVVALRWSATGISPFITISESIMLGVLMAVLLFLLFQFLGRKVPPLGVLVMPVGFVLMGWAGTLVQEVAASIPPALQSGWIWVHIVGASAGFAAVLIAAGLGLVYLLKESKPEGVYGRLPDLSALDLLSYRFVAGGFILYGLMIISGCFWADQVKGSYWNWDPVEVWSLVSWLIYGIYLHLRVTFGWRGSRLAWYSLLALVFMIVSYWGIPFSVETFHSGFRIDHT